MCLGKLVMNGDNFCIIVDDSIHVSIRTLRIIQQQPIPAKMRLIPICMKNESVTRDLCSRWG